MFSIIYGHLEAPFLDATRAARFRPSSNEKQLIHIFRETNAHHNRRSEAEASVPPVLAGQACPLAGMAPKERAKACAAHFGSWESTTLDFRL